MATPAFTLVTITLPTMRADGTALALTDIASVVLSKSFGANPVAVIDTIDAPFSSATVTFTDTSPDFGEIDPYTAVVTDIEGNSSSPGSVSVTIPASVLAAPGLPVLTAVFTPAS